MSKLEHDAARWRDDPPMDVRGWTRVPAPAGTRERDAFGLLPDDVADEVDRPVLVEWRPSTVMGWGLAAVWYEPREPRRAGIRPS